MKKSDLIKLIEGLGDEDNVLETLQGHEEIKGLIKPLDLSELGIEDFKGLLANNKEVKGYYTSEKDSAISRAVDKAIKNYEEKKLPLKIEEAVKAKTNEGKTPEQIALEEMQNKYSQLEKSMKMKDLESKYKDTLSKNGLDTRLMKFIISENEDDIEQNINLFSEIITSSVNTGVKSKLGDNTYTPPKATNAPNRMTKKELMNKGYQFMEKFQRDNPEEYDSIMNED